MIDTYQKAEAGVVEVGDYVRIKGGSSFQGKRHKFELLQPHVAVVTKLSKKWIHLKIIHPRIKKGMKKVLVRYDDGDFHVLKEM